MTAKESKYPRSQSFTIVIFAYIISLSIGCLSLLLIRQEDLILRLFIADTIATVVIFMYSMVYKNSSLYDPFWSVIPPFIALFWMWVSPNDANIFRQIILLTLVSLWAVRLTANWARGWQGLQHEDWRYERIASKTGKLYWLVSFLGIHYFPTVMVFLGCLPLVYTLKSNAPLGLWDLVASVITLGAILIETIADEQLKKFKRQDKSGLMQTGIWAYSRHPNYFGEISFWLGLYVFLFSTEYTGEWWTGIGFIVMLILFVFISVPMMDRRHIEKRPEYEGYIKRVSALIPLPPKK